MHAFLATYHLDHAPVHELLSRPAVLLTGSAALYVYLQEQGIDPGFHPAGVDLFISCLSHFAQIRACLAAHGYQRDGQSGPEEVKEEAGMDHTLCVEQWFIQQDAMPRCTVRLLLLDINGPLTDYVASHSDLSICMSWWNAAEGRCETLFPEQTRQRVMRLMNGASAHSARVEHYAARGFRLYSVPRVIEECDPRGVEMNILEDLLSGTMAYDVIGLEEVSPCDWLRASPWNLLVRVSEAYHAYDRRILYRCMREKEMMIPHYHDVYDTPHHQTVTEDAVDMLLYGDWSIFELIPEGNIGPKTLYRMNCYTVAQFVMGDVGVVILPPPPPRPADLDSDHEMDHLPPLILVREPRGADADSDVEIESDSDTDTEEDDSHP